MDGIYIRYRKRRRDLDIVTYTEAGRSEVEKDTFRDRN